MTILDVRTCTKRFGGLVAVRNLNMSLSQGDLYGLIGPNGAGKTTVFNLMTGVYTPDEGSIELDGQPITPETQGLDACVDERLGELRPLFA